MTALSQSGNPSTPDGDAPRGVRIPHELRLSACERLVSGPNRKHAARTLIGSAAAHGINLDMLWGVIDGSKAGSARVKQSCLAVLGAGATAMLFHSSPEHAKWLGSNEDQCADIAAALRACLSELTRYPDQVRLAQCLIEPKHTWAPQVFLNAGMVSVGELAYMRQPMTPRERQHVREPNWPEGISVRPLHDLSSDATSSDRADLIVALESSYIDTLDCPELCGLRSLDDIVDSHMATGEFDPQHWLIIEMHGIPVGCCLLSYIPTSSSLELVYLGIGPRARGLGLGRMVLEYGTERLRHLNAHEVTCAVDTRNAPAMRVYESLGYSRFDSRIGFVSTLEP